MSNIIIRHQIRDSIDNYVAHGWVPGDYLLAILSNDLFGAMGRADEQSKYEIFHACSYIYNHIPSKCWGSREKVAAWVEHHNNKENFAKVVEEANSDA